MVLEENTMLAHVVMGLMFFPRGGSAHVTRSLARELVKLGCKVTIVCGSLRIPGRPGDAHEFFAGLDVRPVDYTAALDAVDPLRADPPMHPSYEDRPDAPDRVFARVDDEIYEHLVATWMRALSDAGAAQADILHLNHLTPLNEAAARIAPHVPVVGHIHGTELLMLEAIAQGAPMGWAYAEAWAERMRQWASACQRLVVLSETQVERLTNLMAINTERCVVIANGFDPIIFDRHEVDRIAFWRQLLVEHPLGWHGNEELSDIFAASDIVILPSVREQFGQVLVEGMACGLPAIAVNAYGPSEIIDDGQTGWLVPPDDERALAEALLEAVNDDELRLQRGIAAYTAVRSRYSWPALGEELARTYDAVLGRQFFPDA